MASEFGEIGRLLSRAREVASTGSSQEALGLYEQALAIDPVNVAALGEKGLLLLRVGKEEDAMMALEAARAMEDSEKLQLGSAECFLRLGLITDAVEVLDLVLKVNPLHVQARYLSGVSLVALEQSGEAIVHAEVAAKVESGHRGAQFVKAVAMCQLGLTERALQLFMETRQAMLQGETIEPILEFSMAEALSLQQALPQALDCINTLLQHSPQHLEALMLKSNILNDLGREEEAETIMAQLATLTADMEEPSE